MRQGPLLLLITFIISATVSAQPSDENSAGLSYGTCNYILGFADVANPNGPPSTVSVESVGVQIGSASTEKEQSESATIPMHDKNIEVYFNLKYGEDSLYRLQITSILARKFDNENADPEVLAASPLEIEANEKGARHVSAYAVLNRSKRKSLPRLNADELLENHVEGIKAGHSYELLGVHVSCSFDKNTQAI